MSDDTRRPWLSRDTEALRRMEGWAVNDVALTLGRTPDAIKAKCKQLGIGFAGGILRDRARHRPPTPRPQEARVIEPEYAPDPCECGGDPTEQLRARALRREFYR